jgi:hypothetical protein
VHTKPESKGKLLTPGVSGFSLGGLWVCELINVTSEK